MPLVARQLIAFGRLKPLYVKRAFIFSLRRKTTNRLRAIETQFADDLDAHVLTVARQLFAFGRLKREGSGAGNQPAFVSQDN